MIHSFYNEILPRALYLGSMPGSESDLLLLREQGISAILTVQEEDEYDRLPPVRSMHWCRLPIRDAHLGGIPTEEQVRRGADILHEWIDGSGYAVYVHCYAGMGRSPLICLAYLACWRGYSIESGLRMLRSRRPVAAPTQAQLAVLSRVLRDRLQAA